MTDNTDKNLDKLPLVDEEENKIETPDPEEVTATTQSELGEHFTTTETENALDAVQEEVESLTPHQEMVLQLKEQFKSFQLSDQVFEDWAIVLEQGKSEFVSQGKTYYVEGNTFITQNKSKFEQRIQKNNSLATEIKEQHYSELWTILKMYQCGFVPQFKATGIIGKIESAPQWLNTRTQKRNHQTVDWLMKTLMSDKTYLQSLISKTEKSTIANRKVRQEQIVLLDRIQQDLKDNKITSLDQLYKSYHNKFEKSISNSLKNQPQNLVIEKDLQATHAKKVETLQADFKGHEVEIKKFKDQAATELKKIDEQIEQAIKAGKSSKEIAKLKTTYKVQAEKLIANTNAHILDIEKMGLADMMKLERPILQKLMTQSSRAKKMIDMNQGVDHFLEQKKVGKIGKFMIWFGAISLVAEWVTKGNRSQVWRDVADIWIGMIPIAGGAYDIGMAIRGVSLGGQEMETSERRVRAGFGVIGLIPGGGLVKWLLKGSEKALEVWSKTAKIIKTTEVVSHWAQLAGKVATYGYLWYTCYEMSKPFVIDWVDLAKAKMNDLIDAVDEKPSLTE